ncbi:hypothetical protein GGU11DRAFT_772702 [Lentinula aff. detonsa]|nr:hypothetical protein GGU11DRAFT_772702 [Lentinula aff. detonsa]
MSKEVKAWGATSPEKTEPITITRRAPDDQDVGIDIKFAGICHSDIHTYREELGGVFKTDSLKSVCRSYPKHP